MNEGDQQAGVNAISEALGGHGLGRARKTSVQAAQVPRGPPPSPGRQFPVAGMGPSPFVSPRLAQQQQVITPPSSQPGHPPTTRVDLGLGLARRGQRAEHQFTPAQMDEPPPNTDANVNGFHFRAPTLSIDTGGQSAGVEPQRSALDPQQAQSPRRRAPSDHHTRQPFAGYHPARHPRKPSSGAGASLARSPPTNNPPPVALLSSVFMRRKPPQPPPPDHRDPVRHQNSVPQALYFQDTDSETSSQHHRSTSDDTPSSTHDTTESSHATDGKDADDLEQGKAPASPSRSHRKRPPSHHNLPGIERLGELSRDEDGYDFAILLKSSKVEEHVEIGVVLTDEKKTHIHRTASGIDTQSAVVSADEAAVPDTAVQFKLPGTPRTQLRKLKNDPAVARHEIITRITNTGLQVKRLLSLDGKQSLLKVKAPQHVLELGAERMRLRKRRKFDQIWMEFACELRETFADFDPTLGGVRFLDSEKQSIVHALLTGDIADNSGAGLNEYCPLKTKHVLKMFPLHKQEELQALRRNWVTYWRQEEGGHCGHRVKRVATHALHQPIDAVAQYYGERIAYYFAWLELYTRWLIVPSVCGAVLFVVQVHGKTLDHPLASVYALFIAVWMSAFLIAWKRRAATLAYRWGTLGYEADEITRPEFYGDPALSTPTVKVYPAWKRYAKYGITVPSVLTSIALVMVLTFVAFTTRDRLEAQSIEVKAKAADLAKDITADLQHGLTLANLKRLSELGMDWDFWFYFLITPLLYGLLIPVLDYAFTRVARRLTNWENHETESAYQRHLILKVFGFRFVHVFASLYYYAFQSSGQGQDGLLRVAVQLASFMVSDQLYRNAMQTLYPFVMRHVYAQRKKHATNAQFHQSTVFNATTASTARGFHRHGSSATGKYMGQPTSNALIHEQCVRLEQASDHAWEEAELGGYDTFEDYTEMLIQFGYVTFFSLAFPLAPLLALVNNMGELRMDAFKLCHARQRPLARKASGIGVWLDVLQLMSVLAVLTNCLHIAFTTTQLERWLPGLTATHKVWIVFGVEHAILAIKVWMILVIPATPSDVQRHVQKEREHAKLESARAMAAKIQSQQVKQQQQEEETVVATASVRKRSNATNAQDKE